MTKPHYGQKGHEMNTTKIDMWQGNRKPSPAEELAMLKAARERAEQATRSPEQRLLDAILGPRMVHHHSVAMDAMMVGS